MESVNKAKLRKTVDNFHIDKQISSAITKTPTVTYVLTVSKEYLCSLHVLIGHGMAMRRIHLKE